MESDFGGTRQFKMKDTKKLKDMKDFEGIRIGVGTHILEITKSGFSIWKNGRWLIDGSLFLEDGEILIGEDIKEITNKMNKRNDRRKFKLNIDLEKDIKDKEKELKTLKKEYNKETIKELEKEK